MLEPSQRLRLKLALGRRGGELAQGIGPGKLRRRWLGFARKVDDDHVAVPRDDAGMDRRPHGGLPSAYWSGVPLSARPPRPLRSKMRTRRSTRRYLSPLACRSRVRNASMMSSKRTGEPRAARSSGAASMAQASDA